MMVEGEGGGIRRDLKEQVECLQHKFLRLLGLENIAGSKYSARGKKTMRKKIERPTAKKG